MPVVLFEETYQCAHFNETYQCDKDGGRFSPRISIRETRAYPYQKGECDKQGEIPRPPGAPILYPSIYTYYAHNTPRVNKHRKPKLLGVFLR